MSSSPLLSQSQAEEVWEANRVAIAAISFALTTYVFSVMLCIRRRMCHPWLCPRRWSRVCDGRVLSLKWTRYACLFFVLIAFTGMLMTVVFYARFPWTQQHQTQVTVLQCNYTAGPSPWITPCTMSYQVFWTSISSYVAFGVVVVFLAWGSSITCLPLVCCGCRRIYDMNSKDDAFDSSPESFGGWNDDKPHPFYTKKKDASL